jgi:hypothetical protein
MGRLLLLIVLALLLSGCLMTSGEQSSSDAQPAGGNFSTTFVSAEGEDLRTLATNGGPASLNVTVIVEVDQGELRLEMLNPQGSVVFAVQGRPGEQREVVRSGVVEANDQGELRYRVVARGARDGSYQVLYQR